MSLFEININLDFKSVVKAIERVLFEWPTHFIRGRVQIGPVTYSRKVDDIGVLYSIDPQVAIQFISLGIIVPPENFVIYSVNAKETSLRK